MKTTGCGLYCMLRAVRLGGTTTHHHVAASVLPAVDERQTEVPTTHIGSSLSPWRNIVALA